MNKILKQIFLPLMLILLIGSCNDDPEYYTLENPADQMHLTASKENIKLQRADENKEAINFTWEKAADREAEAEVVYYFRLYQSDVKTSESELIKLDQDARSKSISVRELNNILASWNVIPGSEVTVVAEVLAVVEKSQVYMKPEISKVEFNVIGYNPSDLVYMAIDNGVLNRYAAMTKLGDGVFNWKGKLDLAKFWFVRSAEKGSPSYMKGSDDNTLVYAETGEGNPFETDRYGEYDITINVNTLEITISASYINSLYLVTSKDGVENAVALYEYEVGSDVYQIDKRLEAGTKYRFVRDKETLWPAYVKGADDNTLEFKGEGSDMFEITQTNLYKMVVNIKDLTISKQVTTPASDLYIITSQNGLEAAAKQLTKVATDRNVFYYKVKLDAGTEFRFVTNSSAKWPAYVKGADNSELIFRGANTEMFKAEKTATYVMSVNMENMTMKFLDVYESTSGVIAIVGGVLHDALMANGQWDAGKAVQKYPLTQKDLINNPEVVSVLAYLTYTASGTNENNAFKFVGNGNWQYGLFALGSYVNPFDAANQDVSTNSSGDRKWMLPTGTVSGNYLIELNLHTMKLKVTKQ